MGKIPLEFYQQTPTLDLSRALLGKSLFTRSGEGITGGMIVETEAYHGAEDRACHAYGNRRTPRTEVMFQAGGVGYVYLCYGIHYLFNVVCQEEGTPHAILIRAIEPSEGLPLMQKRRKKKIVDAALTGGPGALAQALGITLAHNGLSLDKETIWIEDHGVTVPSGEIIASPRVGIAYAKEDALLPWRFRIKNHQ